MSAVIHHRRTRTGTFATLAVLSVFTLQGEAKVFHTQESAFAEFYPGARIEKETYYLSEAEQTELEEATQGKINPVIHSYQVFRGAALVATAYLDKHLVRTLPEILMVSIRPDDTVEAVRLLVFKEPREYIPRGRWYQQFEGRGLNPNLALHHDIDGVTGATLTARASVHAVRRVLTLHAFFTKQAGPP